MEIHGSNWRIAELLKRLEFPEPEGVHFSPEESKRLWEFINPFANCSDGIALTPEERLIVIESVDQLTETIAALLGDSNPVTLSRLLKEKQAMSEQNRNWYPVEPTPGTEVIKGPEPVKLGDVQQPERSREQLRVLMDFLKTNTPQPEVPLTSGVNILVGSQEGPLGVSQMNAQLFEIFIPSVSSGFGVSLIGTAENLQGLAVKINDASQMIDHASRQERVIVHFGGIDRMSEAIERVQEAFTHIPQTTDEFAVLKEAERSYKAFCEGIDPGCKPVKFKDLNEEMQAGWVAVVKTLLGPEPEDETNGHTIPSEFSGKGPEPSADEPGGDGDWYSVQTANADMGDDPDGDVEGADYPPFGNIEADTEPRFICSNCGEEYTVDLPSCRNCGASLSRNTP